MGTLGMAFRADGIARLERMGFPNFGRRQRAADAKQGSGCALYLAPAGGDFKVWRERSTRPKAQVSRPLSPDAWLDVSGSSSGFGRLNSRFAFQGSGGDREIGSGPRAHLWLQSEADDRGDLQFDASVAVRFCLINERAFQPFVDDNAVRGRPKRHRLRFSPRREIA